MGKALKFIIICAALSFIFIFPVLGDQPPDPGGDPTGDPVGGGTPIGSGLIITMALGAPYAIK